MGERIRSKDWNKTPLGDVKYWPRAHTVMTKNEGTYDEALLIMERNGYPEETYYTFSYSHTPNRSLPSSSGSTTGGLAAPV